MVPIIVIGATIAAFNFCTILRNASPTNFECVVLETGLQPSENLINIFDAKNSSALDLFNSEERFKLFFNAPIRSSKGHFLNKKVIDILWDVSQGILRKEVNTQFNGTVGDILLEQFLDNVVHGRDFLNLLSRQICIRDCDSSLFETQYKDFPGVKQINSNLKLHKSSIQTQAAYKQFLEKILYNKQVVNINYGEDEVVIQCIDGTEYNAPFVLFTQPLGVLKRAYKNMFNPPLPQRKINAIQGFCTTSTNKITLEFESSLKKPGRGRSFLWLWQDFINIEATNRRWVLGIPGLYTDAQDDKKLIGFNTGYFSKMMEFLSEEELRDGFEFLLKKFYVEHAPLRTRARAKTQPTVILPALVGVKITRVNSDPSTVGGSSFQCSNVEIFEASREDLAAPLNNFKG